MPVSCPQRIYCQNLVDQHIDGQDLERELATEGAFNQQKIRELLESLLPVLDFLHNQPKPLIHRDIKPANIIRRRADGVLILVDFGAAKQATQSMLAKTGTLTLTRLLLVNGFDHPRRRNSHHRRQASPCSRSRKPRYYGNGCDHHGL
jgi:serine/threonine protein kinase